MSIMAILELYAGLKFRKSFKNKNFSLKITEDKFFDHFELKYKKKIITRKFKLKLKIREIKWLIFLIL